MAGDSTFTGPLPGEGGADDDDLDNDDTNMSVTQQGASELVDYNRTKRYSVADNFEDGHCEESFRVEARSGVVPDLVDEVWCSGRSSTLRTAWTGGQCSSMRRRSVLTSIRLSSKHGLREESLN